MLSETEYLDTIRQLIGTQNNISVPKILIRLTNNPTDAIILAQLIFWSDKTTRKDGWFYKSAVELSEEVGVSKDQIDRSVKRLKLKLNLIEYKNKKANGAPTRHYHICLKTLVQALNSLEIAKSLNGNSGTAKSDLAEPRNPKQIRTQIQTTKQNSPSVDEQRSNLFDKLYEKWPNNKNKIPARKAFKKIARLLPIPSCEIFVNNLIEDIEKRLQGQQFGFTDLMLSTYLNNERWNDDYPVPTKTIKEFDKIRQAADEKAKKEMFG